MEKPAKDYSIVECKNLILEYQSTRNEETFKLILLKLDKYLLYLIHKFRSRYPHLKREEMQELYHIAVLGLHQGVLSLPKNWFPEKIFLWVGSYIKAAFKRSFNYKRHEFSLEQKIVQSNENRDEYISYLENAREKYDSNLNQINLKLILSSDILNKEEKKYIELKYYKNFTLEDMSKELNLSKGAICKKLQKIIQKLRENIEK